jgi:Co/Zn/Cd efflux system component
MARCRAMEHGPAKKLRFFGDGLTPEWSIHEALVGLGINAIWHLQWADPIAALVIVPLILWEGWEAMRGRACGCC